MTSLLVDNSTLSAVQRLMGAAPAPRSYDAQGDYSALENLFTHLIFYDSFHFIDDYKSEFASSRQDTFDFIRPVAPKSFSYEEIEQSAIVLTKDLILDIQGGANQRAYSKSF